MKKSTGFDIGLSAILMVISVLGGFWAWTQKSMPDVAIFAMTFIISALINMAEISKYKRS